MIKLIIDNIDVMYYCEQEDPEVTLSAESEVDLLCYSDNFSFDFLDTLLNVLPDPGGSEFLMKYYGEEIVSGQVINVSRNEKEERVTLEFGTMGYLYSQGTFSSYDKEFDVVDMKEVSSPVDPAEAVDIWVPQYAHYVRNKRADVYDMLKDWRDAVQAENDLPDLTINDENQISDFGAYHSYSIEELKGPDELKNELSIHFTYGGSTRTFTGFFGKQKAIYEQEHQFDLKDYPNEIFFGKIKTAIYEYDGSNRISIRGRLYPVKNGTIDFEDPRTINIDNSKQINRLQDNLIIVKFDEYDPSEPPNPFDLIEDGEHNGEIYKLLVNFDWSKTESLEQKQTNILDILKNELKARYFTVEEIRDKDFSIEILSMYRFNEVAFFAVSASGSNIKAGNRLVQMDVKAEDIFHYYYKNAKGGDLLKDLVTVSDNVLIFRGSELVVADRKGLENVTVDEHFIYENDISTQHIIIDREKVDNIGTTGGNQNGIVVLDGEYPFNVAERIRAYYSFLQIGQKDVALLEIMEPALPTRQLIGKSINEYGTIQEVTYRKESVRVRAEKRI